MEASAPKTLECFLCDTLGLSETTSAEDLPPEVRERFSGKYGFPVVTDYELSTAVAEYFVEHGYKLDSFAVVPFIHVKKGNDELQIEVYNEIHGRASGTLSIEVRKVT